LADAGRLDWNTLLIKADTRQDYREDRFLGFGPVDDRLYCVVFTPRDGAMPVISFAKRMRGRSTTMSKAKLLRNTPEEEAAINLGIASDPDTYELAAEEFKQLRPFPEVMAERRMGRPPKEHPKEQVSVRYDADVIAAFRATGERWQTRMNNALRVYLSEHPLKAA
jgi:uncharacterized protein (DUF4415 family)